ncbi:unnamed protein product [Cylindrotheca closterium]|uniref:TLC domain-containing protein n=1 Tax=Cylindrotheca closterium TaxID=2856 RepID=A0AAD2CNT2_9STRA|nr:unnamed protein product [Cylindrotheca closterium]
MNGFLAATTDPLVVQSGMICLTIHLLLFGVFAHYAPQGPWKKMPSHTAHQVLALPLMTYITYQGCLTWFLHNETAESEGRIHVLVPDGIQLAKVVFGFLLYWDIPVGLATPALRDPLMLVHHIGMLFVAGVVMGNLCLSQAPRGSYYAPFFLGVIEASSIPLSYVDIFHPKHKHWFDFLQEELKKKSTIGTILNSINEVARILFAILFLLFRFVYFPYVAISTCLLDFFQAAKAESDPALYGIFVACFLFTGLQMHWGLLIIRQIVKMLKGDENDKKDKES